MADAGLVLLRETLISASAGNVVAHRLSDELKEAAEEMLGVNDNFDVEDFHETWSLGDGGEVVADDGEETVDDVEVIVGDAEVTVGDVEVIVGDEMGADSDAVVGHDIAGNVEVLL